MQKLKMNSKYINHSMLLMFLKTKIIIIHYTKNNIVLLIKIRYNYNLKLKPNKHPFSYEKYKK